MLFIIPNASCTLAFKALLPLSAPESNLFISAIVDASCLRNSLNCLLSLFTSRLLFFIELVNLSTPTEEFPVSPNNCLA